MMEQHPEMRHIMSDPAVLRQSLEVRLARLQRLSDWPPGLRVPYMVPGQRLRQRFWCCDERCVPCLQMARNPELLREMMRSTGDVLLLLRE